MVMWAPEPYRARMLMLMILSTPFSVMVGSLISQPILLLDGALGLKGWQWLFISPAGAADDCVRPVFPVCLAGGDRKPRLWLAASEKKWLVDQLAAERNKREAVRHFGVTDALLSPVVWMIALAGTGINAAAYGLILFLPQIIHDLGVSTDHDAFGQCHSLCHCRSGDDFLEHPFGQDNGTQLARRTTGGLRRIGAGVLRTVA